LGPQLKALGTAMQAAINNSAAVNLKPLKVIRRVRGRPWVITLIAAAAGAARFEKLPPEVFFVDCSSSWHSLDLRLYSYDGSEP
jgi:hypothetical protein